MTSLLLPKPIGTTAPVVFAPTCGLWWDRGARKPDPPIYYVITKSGVRAQNVRAEPRLIARLVTTIPRYGLDGQPVRYEVFWRLGDWLALDNTGDQWVLGTFGRIEARIVT